MSNRTFRSFIIISTLRLLTGMAQFAIILFLASKLSLENFGTYTIFTIYIGYLTLLAGFNFHTYTMRELGRYDREKWPHLLLQHGRFLCVNGAVALLLATLLFYFDVLDSSYTLYFLLILVFATITTQSENFLVGAGYPINAAVNPLLRVIWILPLFVLTRLYNYNSELTLGVVFMAWVMSELLALFYVLYVFRRFQLYPQTTVPLDLAWITRGWQVGFRYTVIGLVLVLTITMQRIILGKTQTQEAVGIFQFFFAIGVFLPNLIEASIYAIILPKLLKKSAVAGEGIFPLYPEPKLALILITGSVVGLSLVFFFLPFILEVMAKQQLSAHKDLFLFIELYSLFYFVARIFHYQLYAANKDMFLTYANLSCCIVSLSSSIILIPLFGVMGAAYSLVLTGFSMIIFFAFPFFMSCLKMSH